MSRLRKVRADTQRITGEVKAGRRQGACNRNSESPGIHMPGLAFIPKATAFAREDRRHANRLLVDHMEQMARKCSLLMKPGRRMNTSPAYLVLYLMDGSEKMCLRPSLWHSTGRKPSYRVELWGRILSRKLLQKTG